MNNSFVFDLRQQVEIIISHEIGNIRARGDGVDRQNQYLVEYVNKQSTATEVWWNEDQLRALNTSKQSEGHVQREIAIAAEAPAKAEAPQPPHTGRALQSGSDWLMTPDGMLFIKDVSITAAALTELSEGLQKSMNQQESVEAVQENSCGKSR